MRDINRIDKFCKKLAELWKRTPDLRFAQLMSNFCIESLFYVEDEELIAKLENYINSFTPIQEEEENEVTIDEILKEIHTIKNEIAKIYENQEKGMN